MGNERNKKRNDVPELTIFEERIAIRLSAKKVLEIAKKQETKKLKKGYVYVVSSDGKTRTLKNIKKK